MNTVIQTKKLSATPMSGQEEDRSALLREAVTLTMEAVHGIQKMNDQQIGQILGGLVRTKLLSADDSYRLRDRLLDSQAFQTALDSRIEAALKRKGLLTEVMLKEIHTKLNSLEKQNS